MTLVLGGAFRLPGSFHPHQIEGLRVLSNNKITLSELVVCSSVVAFNALINETFKLSETDKSDDEP